MSRNRFSWKGFLSCILLVAVVAGVIGLVVALGGKDTKRIRASQFEVGSVDEYGVYTKSNTSIYIKELIECQGLIIEPDFEANGTFQVFYYGENKAFIGATAELDPTNGVYKKGATFAAAKYCRIVITPEVPTDDKGKTDSEFKIRFYEVRGYANNYVITVDKDQNFDFVTSLENYRDVCFLMGMGTYDVDTGEFTNADSPFFFFSEIEVSNATQLIMKVDNSTLAETTTYDDKFYKFPGLYNAVTHQYLSDLEYDVLSVDEEFSYISFDVSNLTAVLGYVDSESVTILEIYLL